MVDMYLRKKQGNILWPGHTWFDSSGVSGPRTGVAVDMTSSLFGCPSLNPLEKEGLLMLQNLPSIATGYALDVKPGDMVLDMCAAPGGKTALLASRLRYACI